MTADQSPGNQLIVFDTMVLNHFALADRLDVLADLVLDRPCATTAVVLDELRTGSDRHTKLRATLNLDWLQTIALDQRAELECFATWVARLGATTRDMGEASVFAAVEMRGGTAVTDDRDATRVGRAHGLSVHGTIWVLAGACKSDKLTEQAAGTIVDSLRLTGHRLPCTGSEFPTYIRRFGLL